MFKFRLKDVFQNMKDAIFVKSQSSHLINAVMLLHEIMHGKLAGIHVEQLFELQLHEPYGCERMFKSLSGVVNSSFIFRISDVPVVRVLNMSTPDHKQHGSYPI